MDLEKKKKIIKEYLRSSFDFKIDMGEGIEEKEYYQLLEENNEDIFLYRVEYDNVYSDIHKIKFEDEDSNSLKSNEIRVEYKKLPIDLEYVEHLINLENYRNIKNSSKYLSFFSILAIINIFLVIILIFMISSGLSN